jgi:hypothetical protein
MCPVNYSPRVGDSRSSRPAAAPVKRITRYTVPFNTTFLATIPSGAFNGKPFLQWVERKPIKKLLREFKHIFVDTNIVWQWLLHYFGGDFTLWLEKLEGMLQFMVDIQPNFAELEDAAGNQAEITMLIFMHRVVQLDYIPGYGAQSDAAVKPLASKVYLYRVAGRLLLTVVRDLLENPQTGYFAGKLGGKPVKVGLPPAYKEDDDLPNPESVQTASMTHGVAVGKCKVTKTRRGPRGGKSRRRTKGNARLERVQAEKRKVDVDARDEDDADEGHRVPFTSVYGRSY